MSSRISASAGLRSLRWLAVGALGFAAMSCTELASEIDTCDQVDECDEVALPPPPAPMADEVWGCLDPEAPLPARIKATRESYAEAVEAGEIEPLAPPDGVLMFLPVRDILGGIVPDLKISLCINGNAECLTNLFEAPGALPPQIISPGPDVSLHLLTLPFDSEGDFFLRLEAVGYSTVDYFLANELSFSFGIRQETIDPMTMQPVSLEVLLPDPVTMPTIETYQDYFPDFGLGLEQTPGSGIALARVFDCMGRQLEGVPVQLIDTEKEQVQNDSLGLVSFAFQNGIPLRSGTVASTGDVGIAGYANLDPTSVTLGLLSPQGTVYADAPMRVRRDQSTFADIRPSTPYERTTPQAMERLKVIQAGLAAAMAQGQAAQP